MEWTEILKFLGPTAAIGIMTILVLAKYFIPAIKKNGNGKHSIDSNRIEEKLDELISVSNTNSIYQKEMVESIKRMERQMIYLVSKLNGKTME